MLLFQRKGLGELSRLRLRPLVHLLLTQHLDQPAQLVHQQAEPEAQA